MVASVSHKPSTITPRLFLTHPQRATELPEFIQSATLPWQLYKN